MQSYPLTGTGTEIVRGAVHGHCQTRRRTPGRETGHLRPAASKVLGRDFIFDHHFIGIPYILFQLFEHLPLTENSGNFF